MSLVFDGSRSVAALGPLSAGWLISSFGGIGTAAATMSLIYVIGLLVTPFAGTETKGKPMPGECAALVASGSCAAPFLEPRG